MAQSLKHPPAMQETRVRYLGWEDPLEKATATHSSILVWGRERNSYPLQYFGLENSMDYIVV